jgi:hypothetical protein
MKKRLKKIDPVKAQKIIDKKLARGETLTKYDLELCRAIRRNR